jgi:hypothetical protein
MSSSYLKTDLNALASTIRARLQRHPSHRLKVRVYKWSDMLHVRFQRFAQKRLSLRHIDMSVAYSSIYGLYEKASVLGRERPSADLVSVEQGVNVVVARVGR